MLMVILGVMAVVVYVDYNATKPGRGPANPFEFNIDEYKKVDEKLISHRETRQIRIPEEDPVAIKWHDDRILLLTSKALRAITPVGQEIFSMELDDVPHCLETTGEGEVIVGFTNYLIAYTSRGEEVARTEASGQGSLFSAIAASENHLFVADAGEKQVVVFDRQSLSQSGSFKGESGVSEQHGFILPSAHFDLAVNDEQELWIVNPGLHSLQNYTGQGRLRGHWGIPSFGLDGFSGCCNPSYIEFLSDGRVVTSEKGLVRIKIHNISGAFESVVAAPEKFSDGLRAPAITVDNNDNIIALDFNSKMIRFFEKH